MKKRENNFEGLVIFFVVLTIVGSLLTNMINVMAEPDGASVTFVENTTKAATTPGSRNDSKGTINVITLTTVQQNLKWKAYVGNVTGTLVLQDADAYSIYEWASLSSPTGEVYVTRNDSISWADLQCANESHIFVEEEFLNITGTSTDSINQTFSSTIHKSFDVDPVGTIANSTCYTAYPWLNDSSQTASEDAIYQEILMSDTSNIIFTALIDQDGFSYKNDTNTTYDFQAIVPDNAIASNPDVTYYFYLELSS